MNLSIGYFTARKEPEIEWFLKSLCPQVLPEDSIEIQIVDLSVEIAERGLIKLLNGVLMPLEKNPPKPNIWQGRYRVTKDNWWAVSSSRNTFLCLAKHPFVALLDDRCVLGPLWLQGVREAMEGNYVMAGAYVKRKGMVVENGEITNFGEITGQDCREKSSKGRVMPCPGEWLFGEGWPN